VALAVVSTSGRAFAQVASINCAEARRLRSQSQLEAARARYESCVSQGVPSGRDLVDLGDIDFGLGHFADAVPAYRRALALDPEIAEIHLKLGRALMKGGHISEAAQELAKTLVLDPQNYEAEDLLAVCLFQLKQYELAALHARHVHEVRPGEASAAFILGSSYLRMKLYKQALPLLQEAHAKTASPEILAVLGEAYLGLKASRQALDLFLEAEKANPGIQGLHSEIGAAYAALGEIDHALKEYEEALRQDPNDFAANYFLGRLNRLRGNPEKAREYLARANGVNPNDPSVLFEFAALAVQDKDYSKAQAVLQQVLEKMPDHVDAHVMLAQVYFKLRRMEEGKREKAIADALHRPPPQEGDGKP